MPDDGQDETEDQEYLEPWEECVTDFDAEEGLGFYSVEEEIGDIEGIETNEEAVETIEENASSLRPRRSPS